MAYRLAKALVELRDDVNKAAPVRSRLSDGWIGDVSHSARKSDHNPNSAGVVTALDITNDPTHGVDGSKLADALIHDKRIKYVIWNKRIWNPAVSNSWRPYNGKNPHNHHVHVSVLPDKAHYDDPRPWHTGLAEQPPGALAEPVPPPSHAILKLKSQGGDVIELQKRLGIDVDGDFGPKTLKAVKAFQKKNGLVADGVVGPYTWEKLETKPLVSTATQSLMGTNTGGVSPSLGTPPDYGTPKWAIDYLQTLGWSKEAAIALVANLIWESGGNRAMGIDWSAHGDKGPDGKYHSWGAGQWNDRHGRYQDLLDYAEKNGTEWDDPKTQIDFMDGELRTSEKNVGKRLQLDNSVKDAMKDAIDYWRPSIPHQSRRDAIADSLAKEYGNEHTATS